MDPKLERAIDADIDHAEHPEKACLSCGGNLTNPDLQPTYPTDEKGREVCSYCWNDYRAECIYDKGRDSQA